MKILIIITSLFMLSVVKAVNVLDVETAKHIEADIVLAYSQVENKGIHASDFLVVGKPTVINPRSGSKRRSLCHYSNIQDAIDDAKLNDIPEIRIATDKDYSENLIVDDLSIELIGGYNSCGHAAFQFSTPTDNQVLVYGGNIAPVLTITGASQRHDITLQNLRFLEGLGQAPNSDSAGGGILSYQANVKLALKNVYIWGNDAEYGGGIAIIGGDTDMSLLDSRVISNSASYGGGIYCRGSDNSVVLLDNSGIVGNVANGGGGAYINACYFAMYSGSANGGIVGISLNLAFGDGGGIYAVNGANILINGHKNCNGSNCIGDEENPANISSNIVGFNQTNGTGGGIYATGESTRVRIYAGLIENNSADIGGGIYMSSQAQLTVGRLHKACWDAVRCNYFEGNVASHSGGAIATNFRAEADISASYFENNIAPFGAAIKSRDPFTNNVIFGTTRVEGSVINNNGNDSTESIIYGIGTRHISIIHSTIADNTISSNVSNAGIFRLSYFRVVDLNLYGIPTVFVRSSIIDNPGMDILSHGIDAHDFVVDFSCIMANEAVSLTASNDVINDAENFAGGAQISGFNPFFVDRNNRDYHLNAVSPAIDYCYTPARATVMYKDMDYQEYNWDDPNRPNNHALSYYDIGADESYSNDIIFKDGFD